MNNNRQSELSPRIASQYSVSIRDEIIKICDKIDFRSSTWFRYKKKRNRSLGSAQSLIVEIALTDEEIYPILMAKLAMFMDEEERATFLINTNYNDSYHLPKVLDRRLELVRG